MIAGCQKIQAEIGTYVYEPAPPEVQEHLQHCPDCREMFERLQGVHRKITALLPVPQPFVEQEIKQELLDRLATISTRRKWHWPALSASLLLCFAGGLCLGKWQSSSLPPCRSESRKMTRVQEYGQINWLTPQGLRLLKYGCRKPATATKDDYNH